MEDDRKPGVSVAETPVSSPEMSPLHLTFALTLSLDVVWTAARMVFSLYALELGAGAFEVGVLYAVLNLFPLLLSWPLGTLSDRIGSRAPLALAIASSAVGLAVPWYFGTMAALYVGSALVGLSFAFYLVNVQNLVGLLSPPADRPRNFATFSLLGAGSNVIGPMLGGFFIDHWGHAMACLLLSPCRSCPRRCSSAGAGNCRAARGVRTRPPRRCWRRWRTARCGR